MRIFAEPLTFSRDWDDVDALAKLRVRLKDSKENPRTAIVHYWEALIDSGMK